METTGLYITNETTDVNLTGEALAQYNKEVLQRNKVNLKSSNEVLVSVGKSNSNYSAYIKGNQLKIDGQPVAESSVTNPGIYEIDGTNFSDVSIAPHQKCINITLENYNKLRKGQIVPGYKIYDKYAIYNIVSNINNAETVYCDPTEHTDLIYANIKGNILPENIVNGNTFTLMDAPTLVIRDFELRVKINQPLDLHYYVDTRRSKALYDNEYGETFTTIIKDADGTILSKQTTYAGEQYTSIILKKQTKGDTWFSIQCIDNRGVESPIQYFDIFIDDDIQQQVYQITYQELSNYGITYYLDNVDQPNLTDLDEQKKGFLNRVGFTRLFNDLKNQGHDNVILPKNSYGHVTKFYIDLHKNLNEEFDYSTGTGDINLGSKRYYYGEIIPHATTLVNGNVQGSELKLTEILKETPTNRNETDPDYIVVGMDPVDYILQDKQNLFRDSNNKIKVYWGNSYISGEEVHSTNNPLHVDSMQRLTKPKAVKINGITYYPPAYILEQENKKMYIVDSTVYFEGDHYSAGDPILFPNNFTVNFNGAQFIAIPAHDITKGAVMQLRANYNTHIIGGKGETKAEITGMYKKIDFKRAFIEAAYWNPGEFLRNWSASSARFCSVTNIKSTYPLGYDGTVGNSSSTPDWIDNGYPNKLHFKYLGYINYNGSTINYTTPVAEIPQGSSDRQEATHINLVYTDYAYCKIKYYDPILEQTLYSKDMFIGPMGYGKYLAGKQHEIFVSFYKKSGNDYIWISTIKTHQYYLIKIPDEADYFRVCGYGITKKENNTYTAVTYDNGNNKAFPYLLYEGTVIAKNILFKNCAWSHTRTVGMSVSYAKSITIDGCSYTLMAIESSRDGFGVTQMLGDFEEGWEHTDRVTIKNCIVYAGHSYTYNVFGSVYIQMNCGRNLTMINNRTEDKKTSMSLLEQGGIESAYICNNVFAVGDIRRRCWYEHPCIVYKNNEYRDFLRFIEYNNDLQNSLYDGTRINRCDDPVIDKVTIKGSIIPIIKRESSGVNLKIRVEDSNISEQEIINSSYE